MLLKSNFKLYALMLLLSLLALSSFGAMLADIVSFRAMLQERFWARGEPVESLEQWHRAESQAKFALMLSPGHTDYQLLLGRLSSWRLYVPDEQADLSLEIGQGYDAFQRALASRPYWSQGWSEFALLKAQIDETDQEFELAVYIAMATGPYESKSILNILKATLGAWDKISSDLKEEVVILFALALELDDHQSLSEDAISIAKHYQRLDVLCATQGLSDSAHTKCQSALKR